MQSSGVAFRLLTFVAFSVKELAEERRKRQRGVGRQALLGTKWFTGSSASPVPTPTEPFVWHTHIYIHTHKAEVSVVDCSFHANGTPVYTHTHIIFKF